MRDVMVPVAATAAPDTPVGEAHRLLEAHKVGHLPVVEDGLAVGIVSLRDLLRAPSDAVPVREVMSHPLYVAAPETPLGRAVRLLRERDLPVLPVIDGRTLVGLLRAVDVLETAWDRTRGPM